MSIREKLLMAIFLNIRYDFSDKHTLKLQKKLMLRLCKRILKEDCQTWEETLFYGDLIKQIKKYKLGDGRYFRQYCDLYEAKMRFKENKMIICVGQFLEAIGEKPMDWDKVYAELEWAKKQLEDITSKINEAKGE